MDWLSLIINLLIDCYLWIVMNISIGISMEYSRIHGDPMGQWFRYDTIWWCQKRLGKSWNITIRWCSLWCESWFTRRQQQVEFDGKSSIKWGKSFFFVWAIENNMATWEILRKLEEHSDKDHRISSAPQIGFGSI